MARNNRFKNISKETPESDYRPHMYDCDYGFQHHNATGNFPVYSNLVNSHSEYDPAFSYFEKPRSNFNDNIQTYHQPGMQPCKNRKPKETKNKIYSQSEYDPTSSYFEEPSCYFKDNIQTYHQPGMQPYRNNISKEIKNKNYSQSQYNPATTNFEKPSCYFKDNIQTYHQPGMPPYRNKKSKEIKNNKHSHLEYNPATTYFEEPSNYFKDNTQTYRQPGMPPYKNKINCSPQSKEMRLNTNNYFEYPTCNTVIQPYQSNMLKNNYRKQDVQYGSKYEENSNVLNSYHNSKEENFNNIRITYVDNSLRHIISSPSTRIEKIDNWRSPLLRNHEEENSHIKQVNSGERRWEKPRERPEHMSPLAVKNHNSPNLSFLLAPVQDSSKLENDRRNDGIETKDEFEVSPKNNTVISKNRKYEIRNCKKFELVCPHCDIKCFTSTQYLLHLNSSRHSNVIEQLDLHHNNAILEKIRVQQRNAQIILEENLDGLESFTNFCEICNLNHHQSKDTHEATNYHIKIKDIVESYCSICKIGFKSSLAYENHICSLAHLTMKNNMDIIDEANAETDDVVINKPKKEMVIVGREKIRKVEVYYCDICEICLPRVNNDNLEEVISAHCSEQFHSKQYYIYCRSNNSSNQDEVLVYPEDLEKEKITDNELNKCLNISYCNEQLPAENKPQLKEKTTEEYEEILDVFQNSENKDDMDKPNLPEDVIIDDKQLIIDINQNLNDILKEEEYYTDENTQE